MPTSGARDTIMAPEEPANATHLPDFPIYLSYWRAALLLFFTLPFLLGAISMSIASFKANSLSEFATAAIPTAFFIAVTLVLLLGVFRCRRSRGPMYVFKANGLIVGRYFGGKPLPWKDVDISTPTLLWSGPLLVNVDYRKAEFRSDPNRQPITSFCKDRHKTTRRIVMPNIATLGGRNLERTLIEYIRASGCYETE